ncbi:ABC transporter ATP-binding protein [Uliginosibacterium sp. H3]|uniref:ABC transporter ATP-binding protein n=1 Tax=Uliginosibacterium silvisoli TaxID=3114758 RepID=A0ABU6K616_9RHOO|nr:ABC transporter ATP-binding protein [Uliginosibacterium sp. H3]
MSLLEVKDLSIHFKTPGGTLTAVDKLSFSVDAGETLAIVGESGCGKSVTALALMRLLTPSTKVSGSIRFEDRELTTLPERQMRDLRGNRMAIIFQDPMAALNPVMTIGDQIVEAIRAHEKVSKEAARKRAEELLELVHIPEPRRRLDEYPHRFSGGMRQRAAIAMALASKPSVLIADEPTTALDVTIQAQILHLLHRLQRDLGMALILITHDLGVVAETADRVLVMYAGRKVEQQGVNGLFEQPLHPYTQRLMGAKPRLEQDSVGTPQRLQEIPGLVPQLTQLPAGCAFSTRCDMADHVCHSVRPELKSHAGHGLIACHKSEQLDAAEVAAAVATKGIQFIERAPAEQPLARVA